MNDAEGILGLEAVGIDKVKIRPQFPVAWKKVSLKKIHLCGQVFDLEVETVDGGYRVDIVQEEKSMEYSVQDGELVTVKFGVY